jgi:hypothetical protein
MATKQVVKVQFDPEFPLFVTNAQGHKIEVYFIGHLSKNKNMWLVTIDSEGIEYEDLKTAFLRTAQIINTRYGTSIRFFLPEDS